MVECPEWGRAIRTETAAKMDSDYWQHLDKEHDRSIAVQHSMREQWEWQGD